MIQTLKNYVNGHWVEPQNSGLLDVLNPSTGACLARVPLSTPQAVDQAVDAAAAAFESWSDTPVGRRCEPLFALSHLLRENFESLARDHRGNGQVFA